MTKLIRNWEELSKVPANNKYRIVVGDCCGWIIPATDEPPGVEGAEFRCLCDSKNMSTKEYLDTHIPGDIY